VERQAMRPTARPVSVLAPEHRSRRRRLASIRLLLVSAALLLWSGAAYAQQSRCADCHFANPNAPGGDHLSRWQRSPHGEANVGCERCHGGDPTTFERFQAHASMPRGRQSLVSDENVPQTCGRCHIGEFVAFQDSRHSELLRARDKRVPTCITCHDPVAGNRPTPKNLERECARCHGSGKSAEREGRASEARVLLTAVRETRASLDQARRLIQRVKDPQSREPWEEARFQAEVPLVQAGHAGHSFAFGRVRERLGIARRLVTALLERLATPPPATEHRSVGPSMTQE